MKTPTTADALWRYHGQERPPFAIKPEAGQESVWDYPRPPRMALDAREVVVKLGTVEIARSRRALRVLETASPPTFYLPPQDVQSQRLAAATGSSMCEWKGRARYWDVIGNDDSGRPLRIAGAAWVYPEPLPAFAALAHHLAFYPSRLECFVDGVRVQPQPGEFYAGWVTPEIVGPFKGEPGTHGW
jgi:uncharacterized protein (DUF427 family)